MLKKRNVWSVAVMAAIAAVTFYLVLGNGRWAQVGGAIRLCSWPWLAVGAALMVSYTAVEALQLKLTLGVMGHKSRYRHCCQFAAAGFYFSSITPSATGGQPAEVFYMARRGIPAAHGALTMLLFTIFYQIASVVYGLGAWLLAPHVSASLGTGLGVLLGYGLTTMILLTVGMAALLLWPGPVERLCRWCLGVGVRFRLVKDLDKAEKGLERQMEEYARGAAIIRRRPALALELMALALIQQGVKFLVTWAVYRALGLTALGAVEIVSTQALVALAVGCLPVPGAVGAAEVGFLTAFRRIFGQALTPAAMVLTRGLSFYLPLLVTGLFTAMLHIQTRGKTKGGSGKTS